MRWIAFLGTGLRNTAGATLMWEWIDFDGRILHIPVEANKSRRPLDLPMSDEFYAALRRWHEDKGKPATGPLFSRVTKRGINYRLHRLCVMAGVDPHGITVHSLRHTFATKIYEGTGNNVKAVQELLGHSSASTSMRYLHLSLEDKLSAVNNLKLAVGDCTFQEK